MTTNHRKRSLPAHAAALSFALLAGGAPSHAAPAAPPERPASASAAAKMQAASTPAAHSKTKPQTATPNMPLAPHAGVPGAERLAAKERPPRPARLVDINSASIAELKTLPGIGDADAQRIVAGRPYRVKTDLVEKNVLPTGPFVSLRHHVVAIPPPGALGAGKIKPIPKTGKTGKTESAKPAASAARPAGKG